MIKRVLLIMAIGICAAAWGLGGVKARQSGQQMVYGDTLSGTIDESSVCQLYWFQGTAGDPVEIDMTRTSGGLDGVLWLYQQDNTDPLIVNDDRPEGGLDPLIRVTLPATDWYTIAACRLDNPNMRATTGTYQLTLRGPETSNTAAESGDGANSLTEGIFGAQNNAPAAAPSPTPGGSLTEGLFGSSTAAPSATAIPGSAESDVLADGSVVTGELAPGALEAAWPIEAAPGELVSITWMRISGDLPPQVSVYDSGGTLLAQASTMDDAALLQLVFQSPGPASLHIGRYEEPALQTSGTFQIGVAVVSTTSTLPQPTVMPTQAFVMPTVPAATPAFVAPTPAPTQAGVGYMANACLSGANAVIGRGSSTHLQTAYTAAGDGSTPSEVTETTVFRTDDDLNVVVSPQSIPKTGVVAAVFCAPSGAMHDAGEGDVEQGLTYLFGLDWEYASVSWETGQWFVEVYVNGQLEVTLGFTISG